MSQTDYNIEPEVAVAGLYSMSYEPSIRSYNTPTDTIPYGRGVAQVSGDTDGAELPSGGGADFLGVAIRALYTDSDDEDQYEPLDSMGVLNDGVIWVPVEEAVAVGEDVYVRHGAAAHVITMSFDADFVTSNTIDLEVNSVAMTQVPFNTNNATTYTDLATQIQTDFSAIATAVADDTARTVIMTAATAGVGGVFTVTNIVVAGGASQANGSTAITYQGVNAADSGKFRNDSYNSTCLQVSNARWLKYDAGTSLGLLSLKNA